MVESITVETDLFDHREVKPHFINPCCFGDDFAAWLKHYVTEWITIVIRFKRWRIFVVRISSSKVEAELRGL